MFRVVGFRDLGLWMVRVLDVRVDSGLVSEGVSEVSGRLPCEGSTKCTRGAFSSPSNP